MPAPRARFGRSLRARWSQLRLIQRLEPTGQLRRRGHPHGKPARQACKEEERSALHRPGAPPHDGAPKRQVCVFVFARKARKGTLMQQLWGALLGWWWSLRRRGRRRRFVRGNGGGAAVAPAFRLCVVRAHLLTFLCPVFLGVRFFTYRISSLLTLLTPPLTTYFTYRRRGDQERSSRPKPRRSDARRRRRAALAAWRGIRG
jgi:hypothetical protein